MTVQQGMDSARVREIAGGLRHESRRMTDVEGRGSASARVLRTSWEGPDSTGLLDTWEGTARQQILEAARLLADASTELGRQADQQDRASGEGGSGPGGPGGPGGPAGPGGPGGPGGAPPEGEKPEGNGNDYSITGRDSDSLGVRTNRDEHGNLHHYDPLTGKRWVEDAEGRWTNYTDPTGHSSLETSRTTDHGNGWETERTSTRGDGGGRREWGESWSHERSFDENVGQRVRDVTDAVSSEPIVEDELWSAEDSVAWQRGQVGDESLGASGELLTARYETDAAMGVDATRGAYVDVNAEAGAYLGRGEVHYANEHGTTAEGEGYVGAEIQGNAGAQLGPGGFEASAGFDAFAGAQIEGSVNQQLGDVASVGVGGSLSAGIGVTADVDAEASWDRVGISGDLGATLGIGGEINVDLSISPRGIVDAVVPDDLPDIDLTPWN